MRFSLLKDFIKSEKIFTKPNESKCLIFDDTNVEIFYPYFDSNYFSVLEIRKKKINLFVILKLILKFKRISGVNYFLEYINLVKPKLILSFIDNHPFLYNIKNYFPSIKIVSIQNGMRHKLFFDDLKKKGYPHQSDYILTWGENVSKEYEKKINTRTLIIGSFKNNFIKRLKTKHNSILFISMDMKKNNLTKLFDDVFVKDEEYLNLKKFYFL